MPSFFECGGTDTPAELPRSKHLAWTANDANRVSRLAIRFASPTPFTEFEVLTNDHFERSQAYADG